MGHPYWKLGTEEGMWDPCILATPGPGPCQMPEGKVFSPSPPETDPHIAPFHSPPLPSNSRRQILTAIKVNYER